MSAENARQCLIEILESYVEFCEQIESEKNPLNIEQIKLLANFKKNKWGSLLKNIKETEI